MKKTVNMNERINLGEKFITFADILCNNKPYSFSIEEIRDLISQTWGIYISNMKTFQHMICTEKISINSYTTLLDVMIELSPIEECNGILRCIDYQGYTIYCETGKVYYGYWNRGVNVNDKKTFKVNCNNHNYVAFATLFTPYDCQAYWEIDIYNSDKGCHSCYCHSGLHTIKDNEEINEDMIAKLIRS